MLLKAEFYHNINNIHDAWLYNFKHDQLNIAGVNLNGRYPASGWVINHEVDQIFFILEGGMYIQPNEGARTSLIKGDVYFLKKGVKYYAESVHGEVKVWIVSTPPFTNEQHEILSS